MLLRPPRVNGILGAYSALRTDLFKLFFDLFLFSPNPPLLLFTFNHELNYCFQACEFYLVLVIFRLIKVVKINAYLLSRWAHYFLSLFQIVRINDIVGSIWWCMGEKL